MKHLAMDAKVIHLFFKNHLFGGGGSRNTKDPTIKLSNTCMKSCSAEFICSQTCDNSARANRRLKIDSKKEQFYTPLPYNESLRSI